MHAVRLSERTSRWASLGILLTVGVLFAIGVVVYIPWGDLPSGSVPADSVFSPEQLHELRSYASGQRFLSWSAYFLNLALAIGVVAVPPIRRWFSRLRGPLAIQIIVGTIAVSVISTAIGLPFAWKSLENARAAGVSVSSTGLWWRDVAVGALLNWLPLMFTVAAVMVSVRLLPTAWPLALGAIAGCAVMVVSLIFPIVVAPLFTTTHPLANGTLRSAIFRLAAQEGVHLREVEVADASRRTTAENAQVIGFGPTEKLVLDDTLVNSMDERQVEVIVGHELGHAAHHDVITGSVLGALGAMAGVGVVAELVRRRCQARWLTKPSVVPLVFAVMTIGAFVVSPLQNSMSRAIEARADRAALVATHDPQAFIAAQKRLNLAARLDPTPPAWSQFWWGSHPTVLQRIDLARGTLSK